MTRLLGRASSINVRKVLWTAAEAGVELHHEPWGEGALSLSDPAFLRLNPGGLVPVLVDGDLVLSESNTICRYLAAREQRSDLLPTAPRERAVVEQWMDWQATELNNAWRPAFMGLVRQSPAHQDGSAIAASLAAWARQLQRLEVQLQHTGAHVTGAEFTLADVVLALSLNRWYLTPAAAADKPALPALAAWFQRLHERPAFRLHCANGVP
jgi:glutathione S-transferase